MKQEESTFEEAFAYLYFLMLSADKIADPSELKLGAKVMQLENLNKTVVMNKIDFLSTLPREQVFDDGRNCLKALNKEDQLKCLGYMKLMSKTDGSVDVKEIELLNNLSAKELNISLADISKKEKDLEYSISELPAPGT